MTHVPLHDHEIPDAATALARLLSRVEGEVGDPGAYGCRIEDPDHPWHEDVMAARDALDKAERDRGRPRLDVSIDLVDWAGRALTAAAGMLAGMLLGGIVNWVVANSAVMNSAVAG